MLSPTSTFGLGRRCQSSLSLYHLHRLHTIKHSTKEMQKHINSLSNLKNRKCGSSSFMHISCFAICISIISAAAKKHNAFKQWQTQLESIHMCTIVTTPDVEFTSLSTEIFQTASTCPGHYITTVNHGQRLAALSQFLLHQCECVTALKHCTQLDGATSLKNRCSLR